VAVIAVVDPQLPLKLTDLSAVHNPSYYYYYYYYYYFFIFFYFFLLL